MSSIYIFDLLGTLVFAISGMLAAIEKKFDFVGVLVIGFVTALGGGTLRDLLMGETPVGWMKDTNYLYVILLAIPLCFFARKYIVRFHKGFFLFDSFGIAIFTVLGVEKALSLELPAIMAVIMGVVSATFGGVIRDVLSNKIPLIFRKEIYATACFVGGLVFVLLNRYANLGIGNLIISSIVILLIRYLAVKNKWSIRFLPLN